MDPDEQRAAMQVFLRLVRPGRGTVDSRRRIPLQDLTDLDLDPVVLSDVLGAFGRHRLLSFDRDPVTGGAVVEVAHEALLREWDRLAGWIDRYRTQIRRHEALSRRRRGVGAVRSRRRLPAEREPAGRIRGVEPGSAAHT